MKYKTPLSLILMIGLLGINAAADAEKGNWKKGRIYYKMVCSECHAELTGSKFSPADKTKAEWSMYFDQGEHAMANDSVNHALNYYASSEYRESIKDSNRAAAKMLKIPEAQLMADVEAFTLHAAMDSDQPSRCE